MCYNSGYREYILGIIKEVMNKYDVDGLFCDCMLLQSCYGNECIEGIKEKGLDPLNDENIVNYSKEVLMGISRDIKKLVGTDKYLYLNGVPYWAAKDLDTHIEIECLPSGWSYDFFGAQVAYARCIQKKVLYMTGRFQINWGDFGGFKGKASIENDIWDGISNGTGVSIGDHMHPAENLEPEVYKVVREIYSNIEKYEEWTDGTSYISEIGVLTNSDGLLSETYKGLSRMLGELKYSFCIVNEHMDISNYKVLILPDDMKVTPLLGKKIEKHLNSGKGILSTGESGLNTEKTGFALKQWDFEFVGIDTSNSPYFQMTEGNRGNIGDMRWAMYSPGILMKAPKDAEVFARYIRPYFNRHWDGFHGYFYTPPEKETEYAAAVKKDNVYHICFKVFKAYYKSAMFSHKALIGYCLKKMLPEPLIKCSGIPSTARITITGKEDSLLLHIKTTYPEVRGLMDIIEEHVTMPAGSIISVRGSYSKAYIAPQKHLLNMKINGEYTDICLPEISGYSMVVLEKKRFDI